MKESTKGLETEGKFRGEPRAAIPFQGFIMGTALSLAVWVGLMLLLWVLRV